MRQVVTRGRPRFDGTGLARDLRAAVLDASAALVLTLGIFAWLYDRVASGVSPTIEVMPFLADAGRYWLYWMCQAFGWTALLWAWITVMLGLVRSSRRPRWLPVATPRLEKWHRTTSLTTIGLMFAHAFWFMAEEIRTNEHDLGPLGRTWAAFVNVFVPGGYATGTGRIAILIGLLAFYLAIPLGLAFYLRRSLGARVWRALHASVIVVYVLSVWHTLLYGTNVWYDGWFRTTVWLLQLPVAVLLLVRLLAPAGRPSGRHLVDVLGRVVARAAVAAAIVVLVAVPVSGRDGGRTRGVEGAGLSVTPAMVWLGLAVFLAVVALAGYRAHRLTRSVRPRAHEREPAEPARD